MLTTRLKGCLRPQSKTQYLNSVRVNDSDIKINKIIHENKLKVNTAEYCLFKMQVVIYLGKQIVKARIIHNNQELWELWLQAYLDKKYQSSFQYMHLYSVTQTIAEFMFLNIVLYFVKTGNQPKKLSDNQRSGH